MNLDNRACHEPAMNMESQQLNLVAWSVITTETLFVAGLIVRGWCGWCAYG